MRSYGYALLLFTVYFFDFSLLQSQDLDSLLNLQAFTEESDLQKVLNKNVAVSTMKLSSRETPGIISVITREEIRNSGSRDLTDVLRLVPGFDIMQDLQFVQGLSLRGSWANEGKILVLMDGAPFNELLYQTVAVGNRFPVDAIERIEIIRGPGSAVYGGSAEYGVINIITRAASSLDGVVIYGVTGLHRESVGRLNGGVMVAQKDKPVQWDLHVFKGSGSVSDERYLDQYDLSDSSYADPLNVNLGLRYKGFQVRAMYDQYKTADPFSDISFKSSFIEAQYELPISERFKLIPKLQYINQIPWYYDYHADDSFSSDPDFEYIATRALAQVDGIYNASRKVSMNFGALYFKDKSRDNVVGEDLLSLNNFALYSQALFKHRLANATLGFRFEKNNRYSGAFVPRVALTKKIENFHFKMLYSKSFRAPSLQNVYLDTTGAKPEKSNVYELELGYQFTPEMLLAVNAFHISTRDIIIYGSEGDGEDFKEWYENYEKSGSKGIELIYSIRKKNWYTNISYSFSRAINGNTVDKYTVPQTDKQFVGVPAHKLTVNANYYIQSNLSVNPALILVGKRYAFVDFDDEGPVAGTLDPYYLFNIFFNYNPASFRGFSVGAGVFDLLNQRPSVPQAYNGEDGAYMPIPGRSREFVFKLAYQLDFKK